MSAIFKRDLRAYFKSPLGYVYLAAFILVLNIYFYIMNVYSGSCDLQKGILHKLLVALHALSDLFVKPSHNVSSRAWRRCGLLSACLP